MHPEIYDGDSEKNDLNEELTNSKQSLIKTYLKKNCLREQVPMKMFIKNIEKEMIVYALKLANGNQKVASFILGVKPSTLNEKMKTLQINQFRKTNKKLTKDQVLDQIDISSIL